MNGKSSFGSSNLKYERIAYSSGERRGAFDTPNFAAENKVTLKKIRAPVILKDF